MKKVALIIVLFGLAGSLAYADERMDLSTYYPSPFGSYDRLRLVPRGEPACTNDLAGTMFVNSANNRLYICRGNPILDNGYVDSVWTQSGNDVYLTDALNPNLAVGIGTETPQATLHNAWDGDLFIEGTQPSLTFEDTDGADFIIRADSNRLVFNPLAGGVGMSLESNGNFGIGTTGARNKLDVEGSVVIGSGYSGMATAPPNGLLVEGDVGLGVIVPRNTLDVEGRAAIGAAYSGDRNAPDNGLIVEGSVGIGTLSPVNKVDVNGNVIIGGSWATNSTTAPLNGLQVQGTMNIGNNSDLIVGSSIPANTVTFSDTDRGRVDFGGGGYIVENGTHLKFGHP